MDNENTEIIILAGGSGTRLAPLSTQAKPKQFLSLYNNLSLLQNTIMRFPQKSPIIVSHCKYKNILQQQAPDVRLVLEPESKNTFNAILSTLLTIQDTNKIVIVMPSDHYISDINVFRHQIIEATKIASEYDIVLMSAQKKFFSNQYGYVRIDAHEPIHKVHQFIEKPDLQYAQELYHDPHIFYNSGIFVFKISNVLNKINELYPNLIEKYSHSSYRYHNNAVLLSTILYTQLKSASFDFKFITKCCNCATFILQSHWSDLGSWIGFHHAIPSDIVYKKWGKYYVIYQSKNFLVKRIILHPNETTSMQFHKHRNESYHLIYGDISIFITDKYHALKFNFNLDVQRNTVHQIRNNSNNESEIIEIQTGRYISEYDIVRIT